MTVITLAGTIGAGKSTWGRIIADHFKTELLEEEVNNNPFLAKYYDNPIYAFHLQVFFLNHRFKAIKRALGHANNVLDRSIYEDKEIFAELQYELGYMDADSYQAYCDLFDNMQQEIFELGEHEYIRQQRPDIMICVHGSFEEVQRRVARRGRPYEQVDNNPTLLDYYERVYEKYEKFISTWDKPFPLFVLDIDKYDATNEQDRQEVLQQIEAILKKHREVTQ